MTLRVKTSQIDYILPKELIAQQPASKRDSSRLMVMGRESGQIPEHAQFSDLPEILQDGDVLVINDAMVLPSRMKGKKAASAEATGGKVEITIIGGEPYYNKYRATLKCLVKGLKNIGPERQLLPRPFFLDGGLVVTPLKSLGRGAWEVEVESSAEAVTEPIHEVFDKYGLMPLPPYIKRGSDDCRDLDKERYQTVYASDETASAGGHAYAAPTAGLHFTHKLLNDIQRLGIDVVRITLDVGWGTFAPIIHDDLEDHKVESERYFVSVHAADAINRAIESGNRIIAVGTTSVRTLESAFFGGKICSGEGTTKLFIMPGYDFKVVDALITNFHMPRSSLFALVCAFAGVENMKRAYAEAVEKKYRFLSYGDAVFIR